MHAPSVNPARGLRGWATLTMTLGLLSQGATAQEAAFRISQLELVSPRVVSDALFLCQDLTATLNSLVIQPALNDLSVNTIQTFSPLDPAGAASAWQAQFNAECTPGTDPLECNPDPGDPAVAVGTATNQAVGACYTPDPAEVNERGGAPAYNPSANAPAAPCYATDVAAVDLVLSGITIPLKGATISATYAGNPVDGLVSGIITGFISQEEAATTLFSENVPLIANTALYSLLNGGDRVVNGVEDACNVNFAAADDADTLGGETGFRFFFNFVAERVDWPGEVMPPMLILKDGFEDAQGGT